MRENPSLPPSSNQSEPQKKSPRVRRGSAGRRRFSVLIFFGLSILARLFPRFAAEVALYIFTKPRRLPRPDWETRLIAQGALVRMRPTIWATEFGGSGDPVVLLVHGWEGRGSQLGKLVDPLVAAGFRVIAVDAPAHGLSPGRRTNLALFARDLVEIAKAEPALHAIIGHSFGGMATALAVGLGAPIPRAVLVAAPSDMMRVVDAFLLSLGCPGLLWPKNFREVFLQALDRWMDLPRETADLAAAVAKSATRALIVHDPRDRVVAFSNAERYVAFWPEAKLLPLEGSGHHAILKSPQFIQGVVDFLQTRSV
jgi:pimeloyl-ACP methyl ester carboxylesterase